jgi:hypothetical protein
MRMKKLSELKQGVSNSLWRARRAIRETLQWIRFGDITERVTDTAGDRIPAEIEYLGRGGKVVGFWSYGYFDPTYPYKGPGIKNERGYDARPFNISAQFRNNS